MRRFWRSWGVTILVWVFFLGSIALNGRYPRIDTVWLIAGFGLLAVLSILHLIRVSRHIGDDNFNVLYRAGFGPPKRPESANKSGPSENP